MRLGGGEAEPESEPDAAASVYGFFPAVAGRGMGGKLVAKDAAANPRPFLVMLALAASTLLKRASNEGKIFVFSCLNS